MDIKIDISNVVIETNRLILRAWKESDLDDFYEYASVDGVGEMAGWKHHKSKEESKEILNDFISEKEVFALELKENHKVIGSLGLHESWSNDDETYKDLKAKEIGYVLSKDYWGRGLVPEAVQTVITYCFEKLGLEMLTCGHFIENSQSKRVIEKCGFTYFKQIDYDAVRLEKHIPGLVYILLRSDQ